MSASARMTGSAKDAEDDWTDGVEVYLDLALARTTLHLYQTAA